MKMMRKVILAFNPKDFFGILRLIKDAILRLERDKELKDNVLFISILTFGKRDLSSSSFPLNNFDQNDTDLEQDIERSPHECHVKDIRGRCDNGCNDCDEQDSIPTVSSQKCGIDHLDVTQ